MPSAAGFPADWHRFAATTALVIAFTFSCPVVTRMNHGAARMLEVVVKNEVVIIDASIVLIDKKSRRVQVKIGAAERRVNPL